MSIDRQDGSGGASYGRDGMARKENDCDGSLPCRSAAKVGNTSLTQVAQEESWEC
jgi:hypothetical protein